MRANESRMLALFNGLAQAASREITRHADSNGLVPRATSFEIQQAIGERVTALFLGRTQAGQRAPFTILPDGSVFPLSPYMQVLWQGIRDATRIPVEQHAAIMEKRLPADLLMRLRNARGNPFEFAQANITEQIFRPNPLAKYEAPHIWVDPNGYRLSDRIWNTAGNTRRRLDAFLDDRIAQGQGALEMAKDLEIFLAPGRVLRRTRKPYGIDASHDAMRLARTEISRASARAAEMSANMNPFVQLLKWNLSGSHPKPDICDDYARGGPNGDGTYAKDSDILPGLPAHPACLCHWSYVLGPTRPVLDELREEVRTARRGLMDLIGPILVEQFTNLLLRDWQTATDITRTMAFLGIPG